MKLGISKCELLPPTSACVYIPNFHEYNCLKCSHEPQTDRQTDTQTDTLAALSASTLISFPQLFWNGLYFCGLTLARFIYTVLLKWSQCWKYFISMLKVPIIWTSFMLGQWETLNTGPGTQGPGPIDPGPKGPEPEDQRPKRPNTRGDMRTLWHYISYMK